MFLVLQENPDPNRRLHPGQRLDGLGLLLGGPGALPQVVAGLRWADPGFDGDDGRRLCHDHGFNLRESPGCGHQERVQRQPGHLRLHLKYFHRFQVYLLIIHICSELSKLGPDHCSGSSSISNLKSIFGNTFRY